MIIGEIQIMKIMVQHQHLQSLTVIAKVYNSLKAIIELTFIMIDMEKDIRIVEVLSTYLPMSINKLKIMTRDVNLLIFQGIEIWHHSVNLFIEMMENKLFLNWKK